jgi:hypothetical protein
MIGASRAHGITNLEFFSELLNREDLKVIDAAAPVPTRCYLAVQGPRGVRAICVAMLWDPRWHDFSYELMDEQDITYGFGDCSQRILDKLSAVEDLYDGEHAQRRAQRWRQRSLDRHAHRKTVPKVRVGDILRFTKMISFSGGDLRDVFRYDGRNLFSSSYGRYRLRNWRDRPFEVVEVIDDAHRARLMA